MIDSELSIDISTTDKICIEPVSDNIVNPFDTSTRLYAVNWFNLKSSFFYNIYSLLAYKYVKKVSGKLHFKGTLINQIEGEKETLRENLLIVSYPNPSQFLKLVSYKFFQMISVLRIIAVKQFCFGFTSRLELALDNNNSFSFSKQQIYLVYFFQGNKQGMLDYYQDMVTTAEKYQVGNYYSGITSAKLVRVTSGKSQAANFSMDGILLFAADAKEQLEKFIEDEYFQSFRKLNSSNSLFFFNRTH